MHELLQHHVVHRDQDDGGMLLIRHPSELNEDPYPGGALPVLCAPTVVIAIRPLALRPHNRGQSEGVMTGWG